MKKITIPTLILVFLSVFAFGQKINPLEYLNQSQESLIIKLESNKITYFRNQDVNNQMIFYTSKVDQSHDVLKTVNLNIHFNDSISYELSFLCEKNIIKTIRKRVGIDRSTQLFSPVVLNYGDDSFYYTESEEGKFIRVEINNSGSMPEALDIPIENVLTGNEKQNYMELLDPQVPSLPRGKNKIMKYVYGAWVAVIIESENDPQIRQYQGELLATKENSIILDRNGNQTMLNFNEVKFLGVYTHKNNPGKYVMYTGLAYVPNIVAAIANPEYAGQFLALGIPVAIVGLINIIAEIGKRHPVKYYPGDINSLEGLNMFSRFPQGIPEDLNSHLIEE